jgi:phage shock protein A
MWQRIKRVFRSFLGFFVSKVEDPKLILEQNVRDMRDKIPEMNQGIARAKAGLIKLENEARDYDVEEAGLTARIKASLTAGDENLATQFAIRLKKVKEANARNRGQYESAKAGYDALLKMKERFIREVRNKTDEAMRAIKEHEAAKWKNALADVFEQFEVGGIDATHEEMIQRLKNETADKESRLAMAVDSVDMKSIEIEEKAEEIEGKELLKQFQLEMGIAPKEAKKEAPQEVAEAAPEDALKEAAKMKVEAKKTIGKE